MEDKNLRDICAKSAAERPDAVEEPDAAAAIFAEFPPFQDPTHGLGRPLTPKEQKMRWTAAALLAMMPDDYLQTCRRCEKRVKTGTRCCGMYAFGD